jgi:hypothetical protein
LTGYGWNPGNRIYQWFGQALAKKANGNADLTFLQVIKNNCENNTLNNRNNIYIEFNICM